MIQHPTKTTLIRLHKGSQRHHLPTLRIVSTPFFSSLVILCPFGKKRDGKKKKRNKKYYLRAKPLLANFDPPKNKLDYSPPHPLPPDFSCFLSPSFCLSVSYSRFLLLSLLLLFSITVIQHTPPWEIH